MRTLSILMFFAAVFYVGHGSTHSICCCDLVETISYSDDCDDARSTATPLTSTSTALPTSIPRSTSALSIPSTALVEPTTSCQTIIETVISTIANEPLTITVQEDTPPIYVTNTQLITSSFTTTIPSLPKIITKTAVEHKTVVSTSCSTITIHDASTRDIPQLKTVMIPHLVTRTCTVLEPVTSIVTVTTPDLFVLTSTVTCIKHHALTSTSEHTSPTSSITERARCFLVHPEAS